MHYEGMIIRPPSEADSILLQVTVGCSHNKCTFCGTYKGERFKIKKDEIIMADIQYAKKHFRRQKRLFICDGDALIVPQKRLLPILEKIEKELPWVERVGLYANTKGIKMKSAEELAELRAHGLKIAYLGMESGDDKTLAAIHKGGNSQTMIDCGKKLKAAGIKVSVTVLLGVAGRDRSMIHAKETGRVLSAMDPDYVGALSLILIPGTPLSDDYEAGEFPLIGPDEMLAELRTIFATTDMSNGLFHANHASNYLPIRAKLPEDKAATLKLIDDALAGKVALRPEFLRAL
ncbi:MAG: B12-binding domain-containing radical SAM protein [Deltaproteobacteria bacterium]|nr:B12-binding domain-containing radical SAM protein [Deltaproteobacteria bacterium]